MQPRIMVTAGVLALIMLGAGILRYLSLEQPGWEEAGAFTIPIYVAATIIIGLGLRREGVDLGGFGMAEPFRLSHLALAALGVGALQLSAAFLVPFYANFFPGSEETERFAAIEGSIGVLLQFILLSWTVAALGEEIAFRVVLFRGLAAGLGGQRGAWIIALVVQAVIFGLIHLYKGPVGVLSSTTSGLIFGLLVLAGRGAIWPAVLAHGINNTIGLISIYEGS